MTTKNLNLLQPTNKTFQDKFINAIQYNNFRMFFQICLLIHLVYG